MERISSRRNPLCLHFKKLGVNREYREACCEFLCDGLKLLEEAERFGAQIVSVITSGHIPFPLPVDTRVFLADEGLINSISPLKTAQSVLFSCRIPVQEPFSGGTSVLLDGLQDPGNVGTILRTANAFGIDNVILTGSCADIYNPKTVRATMGAIFRQKVCRLNASELSELKDSGVRFVGSALGEASADISDVNLRGAVVAIGSEGKGISAEVLELCEQRVVIPIVPECESLNAAVAAGIIMWCAR